MIKQLLLATLLGASLFASCDQIIVKKDVEKICFDYSTKGAKEVTYTINGKTVNKLNIKKRPRFYTEKSLKKKYRVRPSDYIYATDSKTGMNHYDRGHLAPDADFDYDKKKLLKVYSMANIVPQVSSLNRGVWAKLERYERLVATKAGKADVRIVVEYKDPTNILIKRPADQIKSYRYNKWSKSTKGRYNEHINKQYNKHIVIPTGFWKIIEVPGHKRCFYFKNQPYPKSEKIKDHLVTCEAAPEAEL